MIAQATAKYVRMSPRKARLVLDTIRGKSVPDSMAILTYTNRRSSEQIFKLLKSAVSNAQQKGLSRDQLYISKITADPGPSWKRFNAAAFGRATRILKRTSHLKIELDLITGS